MKTKLLIVFSILITNASIYGQVLNSGQVNPNLIKENAKVYKLASPVNISTPDNSVFTTKFNPIAPSKDNINAYLLCYLSTMIYPDYLLIENNGSVPIDNNASNNLHTDTGLFMNAFKSKTTELFRNPKYCFINKSNTDGYDPEAMVISTARDIYVVFRGTDRVGANEINSLSYEWAEWIKTDFDVVQKTDPLLPNNDIKAHGGMIKSLKSNNFFTQLLDSIRSFGVSTKKLWITGHSLGGGQAQIFAMMLAKQNIVANGLYTYASPNPGNISFAQKMNALYTNKFQRFEFAKDPVTALTGLLAPFYTPAGKRVYYDDVNDPVIFGAPERSLANNLAVVAETIPGFFSANVEQIVNSSQYKIVISGMVSNSNFCFHHPTWYLNAAYNQLTNAEKNGLPLPLGVPNTVCVACNNLAVNRGKNSQLKSTAEIASETAEDIGEFLGAIVTETDAVLKNTNHTMIAPGTYNFRCLKGGKYLAIKGSCNLEDNCTFGLYASSAGSTNYLNAQNYKFVVEPNLIGYAIKQYGTQKVLDIAMGKIFDNGTLAKTWDLNKIPPTPNQAWIFYKIGNTNNYFIKNMQSQKYLAANRNRVNEDGCEVVQWDKGTTDQYIWVLESKN